MDGTQSTNHSAEAKRHGGLRFSLQTLLCVVLLTGSATLLYRDWQPGFLECRLPAMDAAGDVMQTDLPHELIVSTTGRYLGIDRESSAELRSGDDLSLLHEFRAESPDSPRCWLTFSEDERWAAVSTGENVRVLDMVLGTITSWRCKEGEDGFRPLLRFSPTGRYLISDGDEVLEFYDPATGKRVLTVNETVFSWVPNCAPAEPRGHAASKETTLDGFARQLATPDGMAKQGVGIRPLIALNRGRVVTGCGGMIQVWDTESWRRMASYPRSAGSFRRALSTDGRLILWDVKANERLTYEVRDVMSDETIMRSTPEPGELYTFGNPFWFSRNNRRCFTPYPTPAGEDQELRVMDLPSGRDWHLLPRVYLDSTHDGSSVLATDPSAKPKRIELRDARTGEFLFRFDTHTWASPWDSRPSFAVWPNGHRFAITSVEGVVDVWRYCRPDRWWGVFWIPAFWTTLLLAMLFMLSLRGSRGSRKGKR